MKTRSNMNKSTTTRKHKLDTLDEENYQRNLKVANLKAIQNFFATRQHTFTKSMVNIAEAIIKHPDILKNNMLHSFSKTIEIGEASVMRFCKHLGFKGFTEFKRYFVEEFFDIPKEDNVDEIVYDLDFSLVSNTQELLYKMTNFINHVAIETKNELLETQYTIQEIAERIFLAARVFIYGSSSSKFIIEETANRFINIGITCICATELQDMINKACLMQKGDVAIVISNSGFSTDLLKVTLLLNKERVHTVAVTSNPRSELAINCNSNLYSYNSFDKNLEREMNPYQDTIYTRISQMIIFDTILAMIINVDPHRAKKHRVTAINTLDNVLVFKNNSPTII